MYDENAPIKDRVNITKRFYNYNMSSEFNFGKWKGKCLSDIFPKGKRTNGIAVKGIHYNMSTVDENYISWVINNISEIVFDFETLRILTRRGVCITQADNDLNFYKIQQIVECELDVIII